MGFLTAVCVGAESKASLVPVLVELFTSEGCSSCPPADAWLLRLDTAQPVHGAQLIVLSEHVDYWDHDGWKDPYSSALVTERQDNYAHAFRLQGPYTPQVVVNGSVNLQLSDAQQIRQTFEQAASSTTVPVTITSASIAPGNPSVLHANIEVNGASAEHSADVFAALVLSHAESQVLHGENGGKHLEHVAVVEQLSKIGKLDKGKSFSRAIELKLKPGMDSKNVRLIVFAQEPGPGKVLGAAMQESLN